MTNDLYSADKVNELEKKVSRLEKVVAQLVVRETNKQRETEMEEIRQRQIETSLNHQTPPIANVLLAAGRSCINCENYYFADDQPYPGFSCTEGHWRGIGSIEEYAELFNEIDCKDFTPCR